MLETLDRTEPFARTPHVRWRATRRLAFRFACIYLVLYLLEFWLSSVPGLGWLRPYEARGWQAIALWVGRHVLAITNEIDTHRLGTGSGDTLLEYIRILCEIAFAAFGAVAWTVVDRRRPHYAALHEWLRVFVRYGVAFIMLGYGMGKVLPGQFGSGVLPLDRLIESYGHSSPMGLLWTMMGFSRPYAIFAGAVEAVAGVLLFWQRTATLGALLTAASMFNVAMLNFSYDVPVKLFSTHLFLFAVFLLLPDLKRLAQFFLFNQTIQPAALRRPFPAVWQNRAALAVKIVLLAYALYGDSWPTIQRMRQPPAPPAARYGIYEVETFTLNGQSSPPTPMDAKRWRRVIINANNGVTIQTMDDAMVRYRTRDDAGTHTYELSTIFSPYEKVLLSYEQPQPDRLRFQGRFGNDVIAVEAKKVPIPTFLLATRGFHWISEYPYNR